MADYQVSFYDIDADKVFSKTVGRSAVYNGPSATVGDAVITDNGSGLAGQTPSQPLPLVM